MKNRGFTLIDLLVTIAILSMLCVLSLPVIQKVGENLDKEKAVEEAVEVLVENNSALASQQQLNKIIIKPAFYGKGMDCFLSDMPTGSEMHREGNNFHLLWTPEDNETFKTTIITVAPNLKEKQEITIYVR